MALWTGLVVHVTLRHLVQGVALVDLEVQDLSTREGNDDLPQNDRYGALWGVAISVGQAFCVQ